MNTNYKQVENIIEQSLFQRDDINKEKQFKKLLDEHEPKPLRRGQIIEGEILRLEENLAIVDVGAKRDAIVSPVEMEEVDESLLEQLDEGDNVYVYVTQTPVGDEDLIVSLEKGQRELDWARAAKLLEDQEILELKVIDKNKGGLLVEFGRLSGFVPNSHVPILENIYNRQDRMKQKSEMIGSSVAVKILEIDRQRKRLIMSVKAARGEKRAERLAELKEGQIIKGKVVNLVDYGAFIEIDSVTGLLHISEIAWHHVDSPESELDIGQEVEVVIKDVDLERERVSLSRKELLPNPWQQFDQRYAIGDLIEGEVTSLLDFGAFVHLPFKIDGLIHVSEMDLGAAGKPADILESGESLIVRITNIDPYEKRVGLSMHQVSADEEIAWLDKLG